MVHTKITCVRNRIRVVVIQVVVLPYSLKTASILSITGRSRR